MLVTGWEVERLGRTVRQSAVPHAHLLLDIVGVRIID
jgi:hypothetical protein